MVVRVHLSGGRIVEGGKRLQAEVKEVGGDNAW